MIRKLLIFIAAFTMSAHAPVQANPSFDQGVKLYQARDYRGALPRFASAQVAGYQPENALYYQALCHHQLGEIEKARKFYNDIVTTYGTTAAATNARAALSSLGNAPAASSTTSESAPGTSMGIVGIVPYVSGSEGMVVSVAIAGKNVPALWDTGASGMFFTKSQLEAAGVDLRNATKAGRAIGVGGEIQIYSLDTMVRVGSEAQAMSIMVQDDTAQMRNKNAPRSMYGLVGQDFFGKYVYEVDPNLRVIRLLKRTSIDPRRPPRISGKNFSSLGEPFTWEGGVMIVTPKVNGRECEMIFDTGATTVAFSDKQLTAIGMTRPVDSQNALSLGVGGTRAAFHFSLATVSLGPVSRQNVDANVSVYGSLDKPLLGQSFLRGVHYIVDPEHSVIRFSSF